VQRHHREQLVVEAEDIVEAQASGEAELRGAAAVSAMTPALQGSALFCPALLCPAAQPCSALLWSTPPALCSAALDAAGGTLAR
jgi:hypothetical protein